MLHLRFHEQWLAGKEETAEILRLKTHFLCFFFLFLFFSPQFPVKKKAAVFPSCPSGSQEPIEGTAQFHLPFSPAVQFVCGIRLKASTHKQPLYEIFLPREATIYSYKVWSPGRGKTWIKGQKESN